MNIIKKKKISQKETRICSSSQPQSFLMMDLDNRFRSGFYPRCSVIVIWLCSGHNHCALSIIIIATTVLMIQAILFKVGRVTGEQRFHCRTRVLFPLIHSKTMVIGASGEQVTGISVNDGFGSGAI